MTPVSWTLRTRRLPSFPVSLLLLLLLNGCASFRPGPPPLTRPEIAGILRQMDAQKERVSTFFSMGTVFLKKWIVESEEAKILVVGHRNPLRIKVEITHPWGAPILHVLMDRGRLTAFSHTDATLYTGPATPATLGRFMPSPPDLESAWALLRGYPSPRALGDVVSKKGLLVVCSETCSRPPWTLRVRPVTLDPEVLFYPKSGLEVSFEGIREQDGIRYAGEVRYRAEERGGTVVIRNDRMVFNRDIPEEIFRLKKPASYRTILLDEEPL